MNPITGTFEVRERKERCRHKSGHDSKNVGGLYKSGTTFIKETGPQFYNLKDSMLPRT